jgi:Tol biopolymer transport system component
MVRRAGGRLRIGSAWRSYSAAALLAFSLASCDGHQVMQPPVTGVVWTRLTATSLADCLYPDIRADSLIFVATGFDGRPRLVRAMADGTGALVNNYPGPASWIDFRPRWVGSQSVVYQANRNGTFDIWYKDFTTDADYRLTNFATNESAPAPRPGTPGIVYVEYDNNSSTPGSADLRGRLVLIPDTTAVPLGKIFLTPDTLRCGEPDWDPTGTKLCFSVEDAGDLSRHLYTLNLAPGDSVPVQITVGAAHDYGPRWSPDGGRIVFTSDRTARWGVWVVNPLGEAKGLKLVSFDDKNASVYTPAWTPDGTGIVVSSDGRGGVRSLWLLSNLPAFGF